MAAPLARLGYVDQGNASASRDLRRITRQDGVRSEPAPPSRRCSSRPTRATRGPSRRFGASPAAPDAGELDAFRRRRPWTDRLSGFTGNTGNANALEGVQTGRFGDRQTSLASPARRNSARSCGHADRRIGHGDLANFEARRVGSPSSSASRAQDVGPMRPRLLRSNPTRHRQQASRWRGPAVALVKCLALRTGPIHECRRTAATRQ